jgi:autotransporter translocation and assembly factor TamB
MSTTTEKQTRGNTGARRALRIAGFVLALIPMAALAGFFGAIIYARTDGGRERIRNLVLTEARKSIPGLEIGHIGGDYVHDLVLDDVSIKDREGRRAVHADRISARFDLVPVFRRTIRLREVRIESPTVLGRPGESGALNLSELVAPPDRPEAPQSAKPAGSGSAWSVKVDAFSLTGGSADVVTPEGQSVAVTKIEIRGSGALEGENIRGELSNFSTRASYAGRDYGVAVSAAVLIGPERIDAKVTPLTISGVAAGGDMKMNARASGPRQRIAVDLEITTPRAGKITLGGHVGLAQRPEGTTLGAYHLTARLMNLNPRNLVVMSELPAGEITARLTAQGMGVPLQPGTHSEVALDIAPSTIADLQIRQARLQAQTKGTAWKVPAGLIRAAGAELGISGEGKDNAISADLRASVGDAADGALPVRDFKGRGSLSAHLQGTYPTNLAFTAKAEARRLAVGKMIRLAALDLSVKGASQGDKLRIDGDGRINQLLASGARVGMAQFSIDASGTRRAPQGRIKLAARAVRPSADGPRLDTVTLDVSSDGRNLRVRGAGSGGLAKGHIDAHGTVTPQEARITLDRLALTFRTARYQQSLALQKPAPLHWRANDIVEVGGLHVRGTGYKLTGDVIVSGLYHLDGRKTPRAKAALKLHQASFNGFDKLDAELQATLDRRTAAVVLKASATNARLQLDAKVPVTYPRRDGPPVLARRGEVAVHLQTDEIKLQDLPLLQKELARRGLSGGTVDLKASLEGEIAHPTAKLAFDVRDVAVRKVSGVGRDSSVRVIPGAGASLVIDTAPGAIHVRGQALLRRTAIFKFDGRSKVDVGDVIAGRDIMKVPFQATVDIPKFDLSSLAEYEQKLRGVQGTLAGRVALEGTPARPTGQAKIGITAAKVDGVVFGPVELYAVSRGDQLEAKAKVLQVQGGNLYLSALVDRSRKDALKASLRASKLDVGFVRLFAPEVREIAGKLDATVDASGTLARPQLRGSLGLWKGKLGLVGQPTFHDLGLAMTLVPNRVDLTHLAMYSGGGSLTGKGWATLQGLAPQSVVLTAKAHRFIVAAAGSSGAKLDGDIAIEAALREDVVSGKVKVPRASVWLPKIGGSSRKLQRIGPRDDVRFIDEVALAADEKRKDQKKQAASKPKTIDIRATAAPVYVRGKDLDIELESSVRVATAPSGQAKGQPVLMGTVRIRRGRIALSGQRFNFERGEIAFNGEPEPNPTLDIKLTHQYPEAAVVVEIRGTPKKPELVLTSDPPVYDKAQIVSLILTGQPGGQPSGGGSFDPTAAVATMVLGKIADKVAPELGLDVLRVEKVDQKTAEGQATGDTDTRVEVGKYISERIYLSYAHVFGAAENQNRNEAHVEYRVTRRWMVETIFGDAGVGGVDALWTYKY